MSYVASISLLSLLYCFSYPDFYFWTCFNSFIVSIMELQLFGGGGGFPDLFLLVCFLAHFFTVVITQFILFVPGAFQIPSFKKQTS